MWNSRRVAGTTLIELIIAIVVAGIILGGMSSAYSNLMTHSADPMITQQSTLFARSMLEEILLKPFLDPATGTTCPAHSGARSTFDNVCDYNGYTTTGIVDQQGNTILDNDQYTVRVSVVADGIGGISATQALKVSVTVSNPLARPVTLSAWRTCYESTSCNAL